MKKILLITILILFFLLFDATIGYAKKGGKNSIDLVDRTVRAIYISYLEYYNNFYGGSKSINQVKIDKMVDKIYEEKFNTIILHVSPFSDSIYSSNLFPYSHTLTGKEGKNPGFDYLDYFITASHRKNIKLYAWINPYRITFDSNFNNISTSNPAYKLMNTSSVYVDSKGIYYNPASSIVKKLIIDQVKEIINNYNVDGIHFDDYFYIQDKVDNIEYNDYKENGGKMTLKEYRLSNVNDLIKSVYKIIKEKSDSIVFSIAPDGNINNNYLYHYADIKTWLNSSEYLDMIMPQIYYGFENEYSPFAKVLNNWIELCKNKNIQIVPILAYYKVGEIDNDAGSGKNEWINNSNIIERQIELINKYNLGGFGLFRYDYFVKNS